MGFIAELIDIVLYCLGLVTNMLNVEFHTIDCFVQTNVVSLDSLELIPDVFEVTSDSV